MLLVYREGRAVGNGGGGGVGWCSANISLKEPGLPKGSCKP